MARSNTRKNYVEGGFYHIYNRGVAKQSIFLDEKDYQTFLYLLSNYLLPSPKLTNKAIKNYNGKISLFSYVLMPNHYHLLIRQKDAGAMPEFIQSLCVAYSKRFNNKYKRVGHLFQDRYNARLVKNLPDLINISKYIHQNPVKSENLNSVLKYPYSSLASYIGKKSLKEDFLDTRVILDCFEKNKSLYKKYILNQRWPISGLGFSKKNSRNQDNYYNHKKCGLLLSS